MIRKLEVKDIDVVASIHLLSWQKAFKNILSDNLLAGLTKDEFLKTWQQTIKNKTRQNLVVISDDYPIGFISFGPSLESKNIAEIYGIYMNPKHWGQGHGRLLIKTAVEQLSKSNYSTIVLWVMSKNDSAQKFYQKIGFKNSSPTRVSERKKEFFEECKYTLDLK